MYVCVCVCLVFKCGVVVSLFGLLHSMPEKLAQVFEMKFQQKCHVISLNFLVIATCWVEKSTNISEKKHSAKAYLPPYLPHKKKAWTHESCDIKNSVVMRWYGRSMWRQKSKSAMLSHECLILIRVALKWLFSFFIVAVMCMMCMCLWMFLERKKGPGFCFNGKWGSHFIESLYWAVLYIFGDNLPVFHYGSILTLIVMSISHHSFQPNDTHSYRLCSLQ